MKKTFMVIVILLIWGMALRLPGAVADLDPSGLPAQSKWVIHFDFSTFSQTKLFSILEKNDFHEEDDFREYLIDVLDFNISKDLKSMTIVGQNHSKRGDWFMALIDGNFNRERIVAKIKRKEKGSQVRTVSGLQVISWDGDSHLFFPSKNRAVFCEGSEGVEELIKLQQGKVKGLTSSSELISIIREAPSDAFVKAAVIDLSKISQFAPRTMVLDSASVAFFMALEDRDNLAMTLKLLTESPEKAQNLQQVIMGLKGLVSLKAMDKSKDEDDDQWLALLNGLKIGTEGKRLVMNLSYPVEQIAKLAGNKGHKKAKIKYIHDSDENEDE